MDFVPWLKNCYGGILISYDIVGDGEDCFALKEAMAKVSPDRVRFPGFMPPEKMPEILTNHEIFIQVSDFEGTSVAMIEAMAQGVVPVVTSVTSGIKGVITPKKDGFYVPIGDMEAMAEVIAHLAFDSELLISVGHAAYETSKQFSIDSYAEKFSGLLDRMLLSKTQERARIKHLTSEEVALLIPPRRLVFALLYKLAQQRGFRWLRGFEETCKRILITLKNRTENKENSMSEVTPNEK